jgi:glycosyltransferase involved in cell wall biosynthesis
MSKIAIWAERLVCPLTTATICVAACDRELGIAARTCARERTVVIHNGIDTRLFEQARHGRVRVPTVVSVGRLAAQKDVGTLIRALAKLERGSYRALLIGSGPDEEDLRAEIDRLGLRDSVQLLGDRHDVPRILSHADVFALASIYECLPISVLEAMAAALPVVATRVGGVPELVVNGKTGFVVPAKDPDAFADALRLLLADRELRRQLGHAGRSRVESHFSVERFRDEHVKLYRRELAGRRVAIAAADEEIVRV